MAKMTRPDAHRIYRPGCLCRGCMAKREDYEQLREHAINVAGTLPVLSLTLEQATALLPRHPEWE